MPATDQPVTPGDVPFQPPLRDSAGDVTGAITLATDVTSRKSLKVQLQAQKLGADGRPAGVREVAHDFNNLLTIVLNYSVLLLDVVGEDAEVRSGLEAIKMAAERAATLTGRLLKDEEEGRSPTSDTVAGDRVLASSNAVDPPTMAVD